MAAPLVSILKHKITIYLQNNNLISMQFASKYVCVVFQMRFK